MLVYFWRLRFVLYIFFVLSGVARNQLQVSGAIAFFEAGSREKSAAGNPHAPCWYA